MKACSILCVVGFGAFAIFGFLALAGMGSDLQVVIAINIVLAAAGGILGVFAWHRIKSCPWVVKGPNAPHP